MDIAAEIKAIAHRIDAIGQNATANGGLVNHADVAEAAQDAHALAAAVADQGAGVSAAPAATSAPAGPENTVAPAPTADKPDPQAGK